MKRGHLGLCMPCAPRASGRPSEGGRYFPLSPLQRERQNGTDMAAERTTAPPPALVQEIGNTTYEVSFHFSTTSRETMSDKINHPIRRELDAS